MRVIEGSWTPSPPELETIHKLYQQALRALDRRIEGLIEHFLEVRGGDEALVVITADHGQALGEGGWLFHMASAEEAVLRVPLIIRFPNSGLSGIAQGRASLVDVFPTVLEATGLPLIPTLEGQPLPPLLDRAREGPVWALGDGLPWRHLEGIVFADRQASGEDRPRRTWIASYEGTVKSVFDLQNRTFETNPIEGLPAKIGAQDDRDLGPSPAVRAQIRELSAKLLNRGPRTPAEEALQRLESWGYGV